MLTLSDGELVLAATDLTNHVACAHLTQQRLAVARGERGRPRPTRDPYAELIRALGDRHEREQLERLSAECGGHVELSGRVVSQSLEELKKASAETIEAMREGVPLIYQGQLFDGRWQGRPDFLRRLARRSSLGEHMYEVLDTKLSRQLKPQVVHQLSLYNRLLGRVQGVEPVAAHVVLRDGSTVSIDLGRYAALHRHLTRRLGQVVAQPATPTYPEPVAHCAICALADECSARRVIDDHLSLVAGARTEQRERLLEMGLPTVLALAKASGEFDAGPLGAERLATLHQQAVLQVSSRESGLPTHRHLEPARAAGYALLPNPSP